MVALNGERFALGYSTVNEKVIFDHNCMLSKLAYVAWFMSGC